MVLRWSVQVPDTGTLGYRFAALFQINERTASRPVESKSEPVRPIIGFPCSTFMGGAPITAIKGSY
jgi:hypothetical protein